MARSVQPRSRAIALTVAFCAVALAPEANAATTAPATNLTTARSHHAASLLGNGTAVIVTGGTGASGVLGSAEIVAIASGAVFPLTMATPRSSHTATALLDNRILLTGGATTSGFTPSAEIFDSTSFSFTTAGSLTTARARHTGTLLHNGAILIAGGDAGGAAFASAELFSGSSFAAAGSMIESRTDHTAVLLSNGTVLLAGGRDGSTVRASAELFDGINSFDATDALTTARYWHTATRLSDGRVLIVGGNDGSGGLASAEIYDPATAMFTTTGSLTTARHSHRATLLPNGQVLVAGGIGAGGYLSSAEIYDPATGVFTSTSGTIDPRANFTSILLDDGRVFWVGGRTTGDAFLNTTAHHRNASPFFSDPGDLNRPREGNSATLLYDGSVLIAGGDSDIFSIENHVELFTPPVAPGTTGTFTVLPPLATARAYHTATLLPNGKVLIAGGSHPTGSVAVAELYDPTTGTFSNTGAMVRPRDSHTATLLADGRVLIAGGRNGSLVAQTEIYDPLTGQFTESASLATPRVLHAAVLIPSGVLIVGGRGSSGTALGSAEVYQGGVFHTAPGNLSVARQLPTATRLSNNNVLVAGGAPMSGGVANADIFSWTSETFTPTGTMNVARVQHSATLLPDGRVLIIGGRNVLGPTASTETFDPATGTFSIGPNLVYKRHSHAATLLLDGTVFVSGGTATPTSDVMRECETFDPGLGIAPSRRPVISTLTNPVVQPTAISITGTGLRGDFDGVTNLVLQRVDSEFMIALSSNAAASGSATAFQSQSLPGYAAGVYRATLYAGGIPSLQKIIRVGPSNIAPQIILGSPAALTAGGPAATFTMATLREDYDALGSIGVAATPAAGITVAGLTNSNGTVTAALSAACSASGIIPITLGAQDSMGGMSSATYQTNVAGNSPPVLGNYGDTIVALGNGATVHPSQPPSDSGGLTAVSVSASAAFTGSLSVEPSTGVVTISTAAPGGMFTVTVTAADGCVTTTSSFVLHVEEPPSISAGSVSRTAGSAPATSTIATVSDSVDSAGSLIVTATSVPAGITVSSIQNASGTITALVEVGCTAAPGVNNVTLQVEDSASLIATTTLTITVAENAAPVAATYPDTFTGVHASVTINPLTPASDNRAIVSATATAPGFAGVINVSPSYDVSISDASPAGAHEVTVTFTDNCGATSSGSFTLNVSPAPVITPSGSVTTQIGSFTETETIAAVSSGAGSVADFEVTTTSVPAGLTVSNITNAGGTISASIAASCSAALGPNIVGLQVEDAVGNTSTADLTINVTGDGPPSLGTYAETGVQYGTSTTVSPASPPADNGPLTISAHAAGFTGVLSGNPMTGAITINNAGPVGSFIVEVTITDGCGNAANRSFGLSVDPATTTITLASSRNPAPAGQEVVFTATVSSAGGTPTGAVRFSDGSAFLADAPLVAGQAVVSTTTLSPVVHSIRAQYLGNESYLFSSISTLSQVIDMMASSGDVVGRGDFDGDGRADILLRHTNTSLTILFMNGSTILATANLGPVGGTFRVAGIGDFDGNSKADILLRDGGGSLFLLLMDGPIIRNAQFIGAANGYAVAGVADFNGDAKADIVLRDSLGNIGMWLMDGFAIEGGALVGSPGSYTVAGVGDFDGDDMADILLRDSLGSVGLWLMNGTQIAGGAFVGSPGAYTVAGLADFNSDSKADILLRDNLGNVGLWLMDGPAIAAGALIGSPGGYTVASVRDYNGDLKADILLRDSTGALGMWVMNVSTISAGAFVLSPGSAFTAY